MVAVVGASATVTVTTELVEVALFVSPEYTAVMLCVPTVSVETASVATPAVSVGEPRIAAPSLNVTVPVADVGATVAVSVVELPKFSVAGTAPSVVVVARSPTDTVVAALVALVSLVSPP